jgi:hypothetical protein
LPEKYRAPVVLCYLEGKTNEEAARQLRCPTGTVVTRLARARKRLRDRLSRRGVEVSAGALALAWTSLITPSSTRAALLDQTVKAALHFAVYKGAAPGLVSANVAALTKGALKAMFMTKLKLLTATFLALAIIGTGSAVMAVRPSTTDSSTEQERGRRKSEDANSQDRDSRQSDDKDDQDNRDKKSDKKRDRKEHKDHKSHEQVKVQEVMTKSFKTGRSPRLVVEMFNGGIEVVAKSERTVDVRVTKQGHGNTKELAEQGLRNVDVQMSQEGDTVRVTARKKEKDEKHEGYNAGASAVVEVPEGAVLDLQTGNGSVTATGGSGEKKIHTSNGAIRISGNSAAVDLETSNGPIVVAGGKGKVKLHTSNGTIDVETDKSAVTAHTSNGSVRFRGTLSPGQHSFHTTNGSVALVLPADAKFRVQARTSHGRISSDFFNVEHTGRTGQARVDQEIGENPPVSISVESSNGSVSIRKAGASKDKDKEPARKKAKKKTTSKENQDSHDEEDDETDCK